MSVKTTKPPESRDTHEISSKASPANNRSGAPPVSKDSTFTKGDPESAESLELQNAPIAATRASLAGLVKRNNMELQFWGYEIGNVLATVAGAGGFYVFYQVMQSVFSGNDSGVFNGIRQLLALYPDATVTLGLGALVLIVPALRARFFSAAHPQWLNAVDLTTTLIAAAILCYSIILDTSWIAIASSCFVLGSCLLRQCRSNPTLLKAGGLALACGGIGLTLFGLQIALSQTTSEDNPVFLMGVLTSVTGIYVLFASLLTYEGGIFATRDFISQSDDNTDSIWLSRFAHPEYGLLQRMFQHVDKPIMNLNLRISKPAVFWASPETRNKLPFKTSMLARLPWRVLTGFAALYSSTPEGFAFFTANVCWALGDIAIGSEDW